VLEGDYARGRNIAMKEREEVVNPGGVWQRGKVSSGVREQVREKSCVWGGGL